MDIIEMFWGCLSCGRKANRGRYKKCEGCGAPRTPRCPEYMPEDIDAAEAVVDPALLRKFTGGEDWKCRYCGSSTFRSDGSCAACGSPQSDSAATETAPPVEQAAPSTRRTFVLARASWRPVLLAVAATLLVGLLAWAIFHQRTYDVVVSSTSWRAVVRIERYAVRTHESFAERIPTEAFARVALGQRHHHDEQLLDHYESVPYSVREQDGYRTETYSASESCGQTCFSTPRHCTSNKNGSATCTGGGQHCSTKYCTVMKTRQVPKYRMVVHFRQEPRYRYEPRYAEWYGWRAWEWAQDHDVTKSGATAAVKWPEPEELTLQLGDGERQRETRSVELNVSFKTEDEVFAYTPKTEAELRLFPVGSKHRIRKSAASAVEVLKDGQ